jgi:hypothetical protein
VHSNATRGILTAWHQRHVAGHLEPLAALRDQPGGASQRLHAVLEAYALICHHRGRHSTELSALLHRGEYVDAAQRQLLDLFRDLLPQAAAAGQLRHDVTSDELATYCLPALTAAGSLPPEAAAGRLVTVDPPGLRAGRKGLG